MKKSTPRPFFFLAALLLSLPFAFSGCVVAAAAAAAGGTVAYVQGALNANVDGNIDDVQKAVKRAIEKDMRFTLVSARADAVGAVNEARTARDEKVTVVLERLTENTTKVTIRVGIFGDETMSDQILEAIRTRLS